MPSLQRIKPYKALEYWLKNKPLSTKEQQELKKKTQERAFYVAGLSRHKQLLDIYSQLYQTMNQGSTLADFKNSISEIIDENGWNSWRVETIFRNNLATAYAAGAWAEIEASKEFFPYLQYLAVGDERTRAEHQALNGLVYPVDHEFWSYNYPPNGHRCRCGTAPVSRHRLEKEGLEVGTKMPVSTNIHGHNNYPIHVSIPGASRGWENNVGKEWLSGLEASEKKQVLSFRPPQESGVLYKSLEKANKYLISPILESDFLPQGEKDEFYILEFLKVFGLKNINESKLVRLPFLNLPLVVSKNLFIERPSGAFKVKKGGREVYLKFLAQTILSPYEVWQQTGVTGQGEAYEYLTFIKLFSQNNKMFGGCGLFNLSIGSEGLGWQGSTIFPPKNNRQSKAILNYLEKQRQGLRIYGLENK